MNRQDIKYINNIQKRAAGLLFKQNLFRKNDRILVGLSGGKDSLVLTEVLAECKRHLPFSIELIAVHIKAVAAGYQIDTDFLNKICGDLRLKKIPVNIPVIHNEQG